jgi:uncharacterized integral membrane protein (TIGR00698 family)
MNALQRPLFFALLAFSATPWCGPAAALGCGIALSLTLGNPYAKQAATQSKKLLQAAVVGLGFGVGLREVWEAGRGAVLYTPISIALTVGAGLLLGRLLGTPRKASALISFGTAICGGSAIAAMAPVIEAEDEDIAVSLATVFSLNALALLIFPPLGHAFGLDERAFGLWAALAIHDTSSVVGAASAYGASALAVGTTVKLARAVWIAPSALLAARLTRSNAKTTFPMFILGFIAAAAARSALPELQSAWTLLSQVARQALVVTLFLVGTGLSRQTLQRVGARPLAQGLVLWAVVSAAVLGAILAGWLT